MSGVRWFTRSAAPQDTHRGALAESGSVHTACGVTFTPARASGFALCTELPPAAQVCLQCVAPPAGMVMIAVICSTHRTPRDVLSVVVCGVGNGRVKLRSHLDAGCALAVDAALLHDVLGVWVR